MVWTKEDESYVPECITLKYIIKVTLSCDQIILEMDASVEDPCEAPMLRKMMLLYLYCFYTEHVFELTAPSLPFLKLKCLFGLISFPRALFNSGLLFSRKEASCTQGNFALCHRSNPKCRLSGRNLFHVMLLPCL